MVLSTPYLRDHAPDEMLLAGFSDEQRNAL